MLCRGPAPAAVSQTACGAARSRAIRLRTPVRDYGEITLGLAGRPSGRQRRWSWSGSSRLLDERGIELPPAAIVEGLSACLVARPARLAPIAGWP